MSTKTWEHFRFKFWCKDSVFLHLFGWEGREGSWGLCGNEKLDKHYWTIQQQTASLLHVKHCMPNDKEQARKTFTANAIHLKCTSFLQTDDMSITSRAQSLENVDMHVCDFHHCDRHSRETISRRENWFLTWNFWSFSLWWQCTRVAEEVAHTGQPESKQKQEKELRTS